MRKIHVVNYRYDIHQEFGEHYENFDKKMEDLGFTSTGEHSAGDDTLKEYRNESFTEKIVTVLERRSNQVYFVKYLPTHP